MDNNATDKLRIAFNDWNSIPQIGMSIAIHRNISMYSEGKLSSISTSPSADNKHDDQLEFPWKNAISKSSQQSELMQSSLVLNTCYFLHICSYFLHFPHFEIMARAYGTLPRL